MPLLRNPVTPRSVVILWVLSGVIFATALLLPKSFAANDEETTDSRGKNEPNKEKKVTSTPTLAKTEREENRATSGDSDQPTLTPISATLTAPAASPADQPEKENRIIVVPDTSPITGEKVEETVKKKVKPEDVKPVVTDSLSPLTSFFINPINSFVDNPLVMIDGTKSPNSAVYLNSKKIIESTAETSWHTSYLLSPGKNKLFFEAKSSGGANVGSSDLEIIFRPLTNIATPVVELIKSNVSPETKKDMESIFGKKVEEKMLTEELTKLSHETQEKVRQAISTHEFNFILTDKTTPLSSFLSQDDRKQIFTQTFGGPRITSKTHPNQNTWSDQSDVEISWEKIEGTTGYRLGIASRPLEPTAEVDATVNSWKFPGLSDGIWYFAVKAKVASGVTLTNFYRILIDQTPPKLISLTSNDPFPAYKNGSLVSLRLQFRDNLISATDVKNIPDSLPTGFFDDETFKNVQSRQSLFPDYSRLIDVDFSSLDSNFSPEKVMFGNFEAQPDGSVAATVSYKVSLGNKKPDAQDLALLLSVKDYVGNKSYGTVNVTLANKTSPVKITNLEDISEPSRIDQVAQQGLTLRGVSTPNSTVVLNIYSENPVTITVLSDNEGNWTYTLKESLPAGNHTVYAYVKKEGGAVEAVSQVAAFSLVTEAQAKEMMELTKPLISFKPISINVPSAAVSLPPLPLPIKLALLLYGLSFSSLIAALIIWYRENPPHNA